MRTLDLRYNKQKDNSMTISFINKKQLANPSFGFKILQVRWHRS